MKIWHISDSHNLHIQLAIPSNIDMVIHSGDCSCSRNSAINSNEVIEFLNWYQHLPIKYKIYIAGNHDTSIERKLINIHDFDNRGIFYLENEIIEIEGINIYGTPIVPEFMQWSFMRARHKMNIIWDAVLPNTHILVTHGPPKGILDLTENKEHKLEQCGCQSFANHIKNKWHIKYFLFGHIHDCGSCKNTGILIRDGITYSNASVVEDRKFDYGICHNGNIITI